VPVEQQFVCSANASRKDLPRANEIVCYRLDGSLNTLIVAPNITDLNASGGGSEDYWKLPKGNLDVTGEYFIWTANAGTNRLDAYLVRIPTERLTGGPVATAPPVASAPTDPSPQPPTPPAAPTPVPPAAPPVSSPTAGSVAPARWSTLVNVTANGNSLQKTGGCGGCPDGGAVSQQQIASGDGYVEFTASETGTLRYIGLGSSSVGTDIRFALRLQAGTAEVREGGVYKADTSFATGDVLRIAVEAGALKYSKNGAVFYTSPGAAYPLFVNASLYDLNATINNVMIRN
jgi:hypothetical protein